MRLFHRNRAKVCGPEILFEELETRIVLDASVDPAITAESVVCLPSVELASMHAPTEALMHIASAETGSGDWTLEYSSDPSASLVQMLDDHLLADVHGDLGIPLPSIALGAVPPVVSPQLTVDLSSAVRITGDPTLTMDCVITYNPRPLTSNGIASLSFTETAIQGISGITGPTLLPPTATTWHITGTYDNVNAVLSTMQATLNSSFTGMAEIDITLTDPDNKTDVNSAPLVDRTLLIPVNAASTITPQTVTSGVFSPISTNGTPAGLFANDANELGVLLTVNHGRLFVPPQPPGLMIPSITYFGTEGPTRTSLPSGPTIGIRGMLPDLWNSVDAIQYQSLPGYFGNDTLTVMETDRNFRPWPDGTSQTATIPIVVVL